MRAESFVLVALLAVVLAAGCITGGMQDAEEPSDAELSFEEVSETAGFEYASEEGGAGNGNDGLYVADYDGDLRSDVLAIGGEEPVLFENVGDGFERSGALPNVSAISDPGAGRVQSVLWLDRDNDGNEDLLLFPRNASPVFLENQDGEFEHRDVGLDDRFRNPVGASTADYDGDGCLDLFVIQYGLWFDASPQGWHSDSWEVDNGIPNALYRGNCGDGFERAEDAGIGPGERGAHWSLATSFVDLNDDGHPDVHVANDYYNDTVYYNDGDGTFTKTTLGAETDRNGMSSEVVDLDGDGRPALFVTNIYFPRDRIDELEPVHRQLFSNFLNNRLGKRLKGNNLLAPTADGYEDRGESVGVAEGGWGWAAVTADLNSDGERDAFHSTQDVVVFDEEDPVYSLPMVWVQQDGSFYRQDANEIGLEIADGRGASQVDYDLDGAIDLGVAGYDEPYKLYRNDGEQGSSLQVVIDGTADQTAVGARLYATVDGDTQHLFSNARTDYQSQDSRVLHVGAGDAETIDDLRIVWPDGTERTFEDVETGRRIRVTPDGIQERLAYQG